MTGTAAREAATTLAMLVDELQYVEEEQFAALITACIEPLSIICRLCSSGQACLDCADEWVEPSHMPNDFSIFPRLGSFRPKQLASRSRRSSV